MNLFCVNSQFFLCNFTRDFFYFNDHEILILIVICDHFIVVKYFPDQDESWRHFWMELQWKLFYTDNLIDYAYFLCMISSLAIYIFIRKTDDSLYIWPLQYLRVIHASFIGTSKFATISLHCVLNEFIRTCYLANYS